MKQITVIIPCYNEADAILSVIDAFPRTLLRQRGYKLDILVVDNNSKDDTVKIALAAGARVISETRQGKGFALRTGFANIPEETDFVAMLDGDFTYKPEELLRLIEPLDSGFADVIIGSRLQGRIRVGSMKPLNLLGNRVYSRLVRTSYRVAVTDVLTGYFAWTRAAIVNLAPHLTSSGFAIEMEMITKMARLGYPIYSVPVSYDPRKGATNLNPVVDGAKILSMYAANLRWHPSTKAPIAAVEAVAEIAAPTFTRRPVRVLKPAFFETINRQTGSTSRNTTQPRQLQLGLKMARAKRAQS